MKMQYGKYKDYEIKDIPSDYLKWMKDSFSDDELRDEAKEEYNLREDTKEHFYSGDGVDFCMQDDVW